MATEVELALMAYGVYGLSDKNKIDLGSWAVHAPSLAQTDGFAGAWYTDGNEVVVAFRGTDTDENSNFLADFLSGNIPAAGGEYSTQVWQAIALVAEAISELPKPGSGSARQLVAANCFCMDGG